MRYIFLDIDGVLNNDNTKEKTPNGYMGVSNRLIKRLAKIRFETGAKIILISTWKKGWENIDFLCDEEAVYLNQKLAKEGLVIDNKTFDSKEQDYFFSDRGKGIKRFLNMQDNVESFVILDDHMYSDYDEMLKKHLVQTKTNIGITQKDVELAIKILNDD